MLFLVLLVFITFIILVLSLVSLENIPVAYTINDPNENYTSSQPLVKDNSLKFELFYSAGQPLTSIAFHESGQMLRLDLT